MGCAICPRPESEHGIGKSHHIYTEVPGQLITPEEHAKSQQPAVNGSAPELIVARLLGLMKLKGILSDEDLEFIVKGPSGAHTSNS